jgi:uncharacterized protein
VPLAIALQDVHRLLASPTLVLVHETPNHPRVMMDVLTKSGITGNLIHDAHIAALCLEHGVDEIITADRDSTRFPFLTVVNPFA